ncbi:deoxyribodipyrimidine photo-lyase isoform X1 [Daphnia magna]|uniref:deoxyribodipyrimidine photo-lyase isoform X1 n=2 Tax=Daphnia magna TaxID=35525 RepID=UPI001E1BB664|nr:deoxyribodipyrimidine photo-lyase isoform X1 [Daphnia magna]
MSKPDSAKGSSKTPAAKKLKLETSDDEPSSSRTPSVDSGFLASVELKRKQCAGNILEFKFNKKRCRLLSKSMDLGNFGGGVLYWMSREQRVQDNWALLYAQRLALKMKLPLHVCFCLVPTFLGATIRQFGFMLKGLEEVEAECQKLQIEFHLLKGDSQICVPNLIKKLKLDAVVADFSPLRVPLSWIEKVKESIPEDVPFCQVDAHNIVPVWVASDKQEIGARTIRKKIHDKLDEFLTDFPAVVTHPHPSQTKAKPVDWKAANAYLEVDRTVEEVDWITPGTKSGLLELSNFCQKRLRLFGEKRNDPNVAALSNLSPWLHFGQLSAQRCILEVKEYKAKYAKSVDVYIEETLIRRELSDNFCFYNPNYDNLKGAANWAQETLDVHKKDKRPALLTSQQLEEGKTHDDLWNASQIQLTRTGKMHGFLRMYWAKKILEWTATPEEALRLAIYLNDRYSLDGRDPSGYVGCMWSICGIHDMGWKQRDVFGKIRYMNYKGCQRKFDVVAFVQRFGARTYPIKGVKYE